MHYFKVQNRKKFCHERMQSNMLEPKRCLGQFQIFSQTFDMKNQAKLVFPGWMHYFEVVNFRKTFSHERIQSNQLDPKWWFEVFQSFSQSFGMKTHAKLVFRGWMHYFEVANFRKCLATNASNQTC